MFVGTGEKQRPFDLSVERTRDGGSFSTRHVEIKQGERLLLAAYTSHHDGDEGPEHQVDMPKVTPPEKLEESLSIRQRRDTQAGKPLRRQYIADLMLDVRHVSDSTFPQRESEPTLAVWFRSRKPIQGGPVTHQAAIAFASDVPLVHVGLMNHAPLPSAPRQTASLDHTMWFHRDARADDWLLYTLHSPIVRSGRGLSHGSIFNRQGELVASVAQEFMSRNARSKAAK